MLVELNLNQMREKDKPRHINPKHISMVYDTGTIVEILLTCGRYFQSHDSFDTVMAKINGTFGTVTFVDADKVVKE